MKLDAIETPALVLDRAKLRRNCARMRELASRHGVRLRPHLKTAKCVEVAFEAFGDSDFRGGTVSTLDEAEHFRARGVSDLIYAVGIVPSKLDRAASLGVAIITDDVGSARSIAEHGARFDVYIEIDCGQHRSGVAPDDPALIEIARELSGKNAVLQGVITHGGHSYAGGAEAIAEQERSAVVHAQERLRAAGFDAPVVSAGSTPTAVHAKSWKGVTELRPGVYVFGDLFQAAIGSCSVDDIAVSVLASVVSRSATAVWIDAGALALSQDRSMDGFGGGYGEVRDASLGEIACKPRVETLHQVHGKIVAGQGQLPVLAPGARVRVLPNHACLTSAMFDRYYVLEGDEVVAQWPRVRG